MSVETMPKEDPPCDNAVTRASNEFADALSVIDIGHNIHKNDPDRIKHYDPHHYFKKANDLLVQDSEGREQSRQDARILTEALKKSPKLGRFLTNLELGKEHQRAFLSALVPEGATAYPKTITINPEDLKPGFKERIKLLADLLDGANINPVYVDGHGQCIEVNQGDAINTTLLLKPPNILISPTLLYSKEARTGLYEVLGHMIHSPSNNTTFDVFGAMDKCPPSQRGRTYMQISPEFYGYCVPTTGEIRVYCGKTLKGEEVKQLELYNILFMHELGHRLQEPRSISEQLSNDVKIIDTVRSLIDNNFGYQAWWLENLTRFIIERNADAFAYSANIILRGKGCPLASKDTIKRAQTKREDMSFYVSGQSA